MNILKKVVVFVLLLATVPFVYSEAFALIFTGISKNSISVIADVLFLAIYLTKNLVRTKTKSKKAYVLTLFIIYTLALFLTLIALLSF